MSGPNTSYSMTGLGTTMVLTPLATTGNSSPSPLTVLLISIDGPNWTRDKVDTTLLNSNIKTSKPLLAEGEYTLTIRHNTLDPSCQALEAAAYAFPCPFYDGLITYQDGGTTMLEGYPTGYSISGTEVGGLIQASVPFTITKTPVNTSSTTGLAN